MYQGQIQASCISADPTVSLYLRTYSKKAYLFKIKWNSSFDDLKDIVEERTKIKNQRIILFYKGNQLNSKKPLQLTDKSIIHVIDYAHVNRPVISILVKIADTNHKEKVKVSTSVVIGDFFEEQFGSKLAKTSQDYVLFYVGKQLDFRNTFLQELVEDGAEILCMERKNIVKRQTKAKPQIGKIVNQIKSKQMIITKEYNNQVHQEVKLEQFDNPNLKTEDFLKQEESTQHLQNHQVNSLQSMAILSQKSTHGGNPQSSAFLQKDLTEKPINHKKKSDQQKITSLEHLPLTAEQKCQQGHQVQEVKPETVKLSQISENVQKSSKPQSSQSNGLQSQIKKITVQSLSSEQNLQIKPIQPQSYANNLRIGRFQTLNRDEVEFYFQFIEAIQQRQSQPGERDYFLETHSEDQDIFKTKPYILAYLNEKFGAEKYHEEKIQEKPVEYQQKADIHELQPLQEVAEQNLSKQEKKSSSIGQPIVEEFQTSHQVGQMFSKRQFFSFQDQISANESNPNNSLSFERQIQAEQPKKGMNSQQKTKVQRTNSTQLINEAEDFMDNHEVHFGNVFSNYAHKFGDNFKSFFGNFGGKK